MAHETTDIGQLLSPLRDDITDGLKLFFIEGDAITEVLYQLRSFVDFTPALYDGDIGQSRGLIQVDSENNVVVIGHHSVTGHINTEDQVFFNPVSAVIEATLGVRRQLSCPVVLPQLKMLPKHSCCFTIIILRFSLYFIFPRAKLSEDQFVSPCCPPVFYSAL